MLAFVLKSFHCSSRNFEITKGYRSPDTRTMADVRSMLRNERAQRRINHPQAHYSATGTLECTVCHIPLKSDAEVWKKHLRTPQHAIRAERLRISTSKPTEQPTTREVSNGNKKRKASDGEGDSRKRTKPVLDSPGSFFDEINETSKDASTEDFQATSDAPIKPTPPTTTLPSHTVSTPPVPAQIDEDEWAAFERDVATPPPDPGLPSALTAEATITAAPITAAELAAQSQEEANIQSKERREAEIEGEKEDAARALEEEFDEMEGLEERVRRLREMREGLRKKQAREMEEGVKVVEGIDKGVRDEKDEVDDASDDEEEDTDVDWGTWGR